MTFLAVTTTADRAQVVISADSVMGMPPAAADFPPLADTYAESYREAYTDRGPPPLAVIGTTVKVCRVGEFVTAGLGQLWPWGAWLAGLQAGGVVTFAAARAAARSLHALNEAPRRTPGVPPLELLHILLAGVDQRRAVCLRYTSPAWEPAELGVGHVLHPPPLEDDPAYDELLAAWEPAVAGQDVERFHRLCFENVVRASQGRRMRHAGVYGGELVTLAVSVAQSEAGVFHAAT